jgi:phosphatidylserine decarboxylase
MPDRAIPWRARLAAAVLDLSPDWGASAASKAIGAAARVRLPARLSQAMVSAYVRYFDVDLQDVEPPTPGYRSFNAFFTRPLRPGARPVDSQPDAVVSPSDGLLRSIDPVEQGTTICAKGHAYTIGELLADEDAADAFIGGHATTVYLHPRDYHRVHSPCDGRVRGVTLVPGRLLPVTAASLARVPRLFAVNERLVHLLDTAAGPVAVVMIAAFGVGHMSCAYHPVDAHPHAVQQIALDPPADLRKGEELGTFHLGSTVVLLTPRGVHPAAPATPTSVRMGQVLLRNRRT